MLIKCYYSVSACLVYRETLRDFLNHEDFMHIDVFFTVNNPTLKIFADDPDCKKLTLQTLFI